MMVDLEELSCPISMQLMTDPVMADDGHTYQRDAIETWIKKCTAGKECDGCTH
jgi:pyridoxal/pyridoxine/pyridoxamine kinase